MNIAHPNYTYGDDISSLDEASIQFGSAHHAPQSPLQPQVACALSFSPDPLNGTKPPKKHCKFRFTSHGGFLMSFESMNLANATDNKHYHIHSNNKASLPLLSSPSVFPPVHSDASLMHYSMWIKIGLVMVILLNMVAQFHPVLFPLHMLQALQAQFPLIKMIHRWMVRNLQHQSTQEHTILN